MAKFTTERIRNIVLLSHSGAGKTILAEAMLHTTGATTRLGRVEDGTTASDFEPEEHKRTTSVNAAVLNAQWKDHKINVLDTPDTPTTEARSFLVFESPTPPLYWSRPRRG